MGIDSQIILVIVVVIVALGFDFLNGLNDAANVIAQAVITAIRRGDWVPATGNWRIRLCRGRGNACLCGL
jgi:hypothetical protein